MELKAASDKLAARGEAAQEEEEAIRAAIRKQLKEVYEEKVAHKDFALREKEKECERIKQCLGDFQGKSRYDLLSCTGKTYEETCVSVMRKVGEMISRMCPGLGRINVERTSKQCHRGDAAMDIHAKGISTPIVNVVQDSKDYSNPVPAIEVAKFHSDVVGSAEMKGAITTVGILCSRRTEFSGHRTGPGKHGNYPCLYLSDQGEESMCNCIYFFLKTHVDDALLDVHGSIAPRRDDALYYLSNYFERGCLPALRKQRDALTRTIKEAEQQLTACREASATRLQQPRKRRKRWPGASHQPKLCFSSVASLSHAEGSATSRRLVREDPEKSLKSLPRNTLRVTDDKGTIL